MDKDVSALENESIGDGGEAPEAPAVEDDGNGNADGREPRRKGSGHVVKHLTPAERAARGKAARADASRGSHGRWEPSPARADPVVLLEEQAQARVPELV